MHVAAPFYTNVIKTHFCLPCYFCSHLCHYLTLVQALTRLSLTLYPTFAHDLTIYLIHAPKRSLAHNATTAFDHNPIPVLAVTSTFAFFGNVRFCVYLYILLLSLLQLFFDQSK